MSACQPIDETSYEIGHRRACLAMLQQVLQSLGYDDPAARQASWVLEREEVICALRQACAEHGDNDWDDDLHLRDVIDKHLMRYVEAP